MRKLWMLVTAIVFSSPLLAQKDSAKKLDPVIVTANKFEQKQSTTGKVVTVITKEQIEKSAGKTVAQVLNEQAGIIINGAYNSPGTVQSVFMRGANVGRVQILMDGIPVNDPSNVTNDFDLNFFSINDVERIEICKGAQSTLYGSDAIAGVINIITVKKDISKPFNLKATSSFGNKSTTRNNVQVFGKAGEFTYTTRFAKLTTNGFSAAYDSTGKNNYDNDGYNGDVINASVQYQVSSAFALRTFIQNSQYKAGVDASVFKDKRDYFIKNKNFFTGAGFNYKHKVFSITGNYQYGELRRLYDDNASIPGATTFSLNDYNGRTQFAELYGNVTLAKGLTLLAGGDYRYSNMDNTYKSDGPFGPYNSGFPDTSMNLISAYASLYYTYGNFTIEVGGRYNDHSKYGTNYTYTINPSLKIDDHLRIFGSIATGFKAPSLYQLFAGVNPSNPSLNAGPGNPDLKAEKSINYELGLQQSYTAFNHRLVGFYRDIKDGIDYQTNQSPKPSIYFNYANQIVRGLEYEANVRPFKGFNLTANYTWISPDDYTQNRVTTNDTLYDYVLRRPNHSLNVTAGYDILPGLYVSVSGKYVSSRYDVGGYKKNDIKLSDYTIFNAYAEYKMNDMIKLFADVQNFTNKKFFDLRGYTSIPVLVQAGLTFNL